MSKVRRAPTSKFRPEFRSASSIKTPKVILPDIGILVRNGQEEERVNTTNTTVVKGGEKINVPNLDSPISGYMSSTIDEAEDEGGKFQTVIFSVSIDTICGHDIVMERNSGDTYNVRHKPSRAASFRDQDVTEVREFECCKEKDKEKLYTSKDL